MAPKATDNASFDVGWWTIRRHEVVRDHVGQRALVLWVFIFVNLDEVLLLRFGWNVRQAKGRSINILAKKVHRIQGWQLELVGEIDMQNESPFVLIRLAVKRLPCISASVVVGLPWKDIVAASPEGPTRPTLYHIELSLAIKVLPRRCK